MPTLSCFTVFLCFGDRKIQGFVESVNNIVLAKLIKNNDGDEK